MDLKFRAVCLHAASLIFRFVYFLSRLRSRARARGQTNHFMRRKAKRIRLFVPSCGGLFRKKRAARRGGRMSKRVASGEDLLRIRRKRSLLLKRGFLFLPSSPLILFVTQLRSSSGESREGNFLVKITEWGHGI